MLDYDGIIVTDEKNRLFSAIVTAEVEDTQGQFVSVDTFKSSFFKNKIKAKGEIPLTWNHSNKIVGAITDGEEVDLDGIRAFKVYGYIYPSDPENTMYDTVWSGIQSGQATGLSIGGGVPVYRDFINKAGRVLKELVTIPLMEIALVFGTKVDGSLKNPANPLAKIVASSMAKSDYMEKPGNVDEEKWNEAKAKVKEEYPELEENDKFYALTQTIYQNMTKTEEVKQDTPDVISMDVPLITRLFEYFNETKMEDVDLHKILTNIINESKGGVLDINNYDTLINIKDSEVEKMEGNENPTPTAPDKLDTVIEMLKELISKVSAPAVEKEEKPIEEPKEEVKEEPKETPIEEKKELEEMKKSVDALKGEIEGMKKMAVATTPSVSTIEANEDNEPKSIWEAVSQKKI